MKNKKWLLLLIIAFPSAFWLILESSTIQSKKLPYYGPKHILSNGDTAFYTASNPVPSRSLKTLTDSSLQSAYILSILHPKYQKDGYRLSGFWEYLSYKPSKIAQIPFVFLYPGVSDSSNIPSELFPFSKHKNIEFIPSKKDSYESLWKSYFQEKPYYVDYSFFILIDAHKHIRGYYDVRYASEMKRLIEEYQHLRLKEEKQKLIKTNEIETHS